MTNSTSRSRDLLIILTYLAATVFAGAALAPLLFKFGRGAAEVLENGNLLGISFFRWLHKVATESAFSRYFNRAVLVAAVIGLWPVLKWLRMRRSDFGLSKDPFGGRHLVLGFLLAAGLLFQMGLCYATADLFRVKAHLDLGDALKKAILTATGVSILEEVLFGVSLRDFCSDLSIAGAAWIAIAVLFAVLHFLKPPEGFEILDDKIHLGSGFELAGVILGQFSNFDTVVADFGTLLLVGLLLGYARLRTGALWLPIGLHAGWVFGVFAFRGMFHAHPRVQAGDYLPWLGESLKTGIFPLAVLAVTGGLLVWWLNHTLPPIRRDQS